MASSNIQANGFSCLAVKTVVDHNSWVTRSASVRHCFEAGWRIGNVARASQQEKYRVSGDGGGRGKTLLRGAGGGVASRRRDIAGRGVEPFHLQALPVL